MDYDRLIGEATTKTLQFQDIGQRSKEELKTTFTVALSFWSEVLKLGFCILQITQVLSKHL